MHKWWSHTVQNNNIQVPPTIQRQQQEKWRRQHDAQRQRRDSLAILDLHPTQEEVELEALIDADQPATKAPRTPAHTSSIAGLVRSTLARNQSSDGN